MTEYDPPKALVSWLQALYVRSIKVKPLIFPETQLLLYLFIISIYYIYFAG